MTCLRDVFVRGKYRDVILPMCVLRRLDAVLEPTKQAVLDTKRCSMTPASPSSERRCAGPPGRPSTTPRAFVSAICAPAPVSSSFLQDFEDYLNGFSPNVQDILEQLRVSQSACRTLEIRCARDADREVP